MTTIKTYMLTFYKKNHFHNFSYRHSLWPPGLRLRTFIEIDGSVCKISGGNVGSGIHVHFNPILCFVLAITQTKSRFMVYGV
jgi:hypothetical protein